MLREDTIYSSLPQDEGMTPRSSFISRSAPNPHNRRDFKIATILTIGVIIAGLGLAATLPFIIRAQAQDVSVNDLPEDYEYDEFWNSHLQASDGIFDILDDSNETKSNDDPKIPTAKATTVKVTTKSGPLVEEPTEKPFLRPKPVLVTFEEEYPPYDVKATTVPPLASTSFPDDNNAWLLTSINEEPSVVENGGTDFNVITEYPNDYSFSAQFGFDGSDLVTEKVDEGNSGNVKPTSNSILANKIPTINSEGDIDMNQLLDEIYGEEGSAKPSNVDDGSWMSSVLSTQDKVTLIVLASTVVLAIASVITAVGCLVYSRVASRRRRINIQNVITDLQSRDKIVLLNSESEEE